MPGTGGGGSAADDPIQIAYAGLGGGAEPQAVIGGGAKPPSGGTDQDHGVNETQQKAAYVGGGTGVPSEPALTRTDDSSYEAILVAIFIAFAVIVLKWPRKK